jgi:hypothetical protein
MGKGQEEVNLTRLMQEEKSRKEEKWGVLAIGPKEQRKKVHLFVT